MESYRVRFVQFRQNFSLAFGISAALIFSYLSMTSWLRRLPTLTILLRRRLRNAVSGTSTSAAVTIAPEQLWAQNNTLPGNRKDGFRFDYLLFLIVVTPIYLWFELSFGVNLLDKMGGDVPTEATDSIEHWGRIISGVAVALVFLKGWLQQCEKWNRPWKVRVAVSVAICLFSIAMTWEIQNTVIDFYVKRANAEIPVALASLSALVVGGVLVFRLWLQSSVMKRRRGIIPTLAGLLVIVVVGGALISNLDRIISFVTQHIGVSDQLVKNLGQERQQAATLTLVRRGLQQGHYAFSQNPIAPDTVTSAEGKAALALFPIIGANMNQPHFANDREMILYELMYRDWDEMSGANSYAAFQEGERNLEQVHGEGYKEASTQYKVDLKTKGRSVADTIWNEKIRSLLNGEFVAPGLTLAEFMHQPAIPKFIRKDLGCFECELSAGMPPEDVKRELFKWTQAHKVKNMLNTLESPEHFEKGHDGETAARAYWVPIWALLFSMVGAFTHIFKMVFTLTEYIQRKAFQRANAADSELANVVVWNAKILIAVALLFIALFIYFSDNRVTGNENYADLHRQMWRSEPIVGAIAAHWTINAQGLVYPFTKKIRPGWLTFADDPLDWLPFLHKADVDE
jgi:hypothetical protein